MSRPQGAWTLRQENDMKALSTAIAALAIVGSLVIGTPAVTASVSSVNGAGGCCKDML